MIGVDLRVALHLRAGHEFFSAIRLERLLAKNPARILRHREACEGPSCSEDSSAEWPDERTGRPISA